MVAATHTTIEAESEETFAVCLCLSVWRPVHSAPLPSPRGRLVGWQREDGLASMGSRRRWDDALHLLALLMLLLSPVPPRARARRDAEVYCGVCRALVDEIDWAVKKVDPKKTIQVGSFRISPDGSQKPNEIPYARSETHLLELFEDICSSMDDYALYVDPDTQKRSYMRFAPRDSEKMGSVDFKNFKFDPENSKSLKFVCENIVEEYEDEIISLFTHEADHVADKLCNAKSEFCDPSVQTLHPEL